MYVLLFIPKREVLHFRTYSSGTLFMMKRDTLAKLAGDFNYVRLPISRDDSPESSKIKCLVNILPKNLGYWLVSLLSMM